MKLENQVLNIDQVQELQELGFDVSKYASMDWGITNQEDFELNTLDKCKYLICIPTLTIGDIMEILPAKIKLYPRIYELFISKFAISFFCRNGTTAFETSFKENKTFINALFETLKWCIKEKHI